MKNMLFLLFFALSANAQKIDSIDIKRVDSLLKVCTKLGNEQKLDSFLLKLEEAEKICLEKLGQNTAQFGTCCHKRAWAMAKLGNYVEAEKGYLQAISIRGQVLSTENAEYGMSCNNLAVIYDDLGQLEKAEQIHLENLARREKLFGKKHADCAATLTNLASVYHQLGRFEQAQATSRAAIAIFGELLGKEHPFYVGNLQNLAATISDMGDFEKAEKVLLEILEIDEKTGQNTTTSHAATLNSLSIIYQNLGNYDRAEALNLEGQRILENTIGKKNAQYFGLLNNQAVIYQNSGGLEKVEPLYLEAKSIIEQTVGTEHLDYAINLQNLAALYLVMDRPKIAASLISESLAIREKTLGKFHADYAKCLETRSGIYLALGNPEKATADALQTVDIYAHALGKKHLFYANGLENLANLYTVTEQFEKAKSTFEELAEVNKTLTINALHHLSAREMNQYLIRFSKNQAAILSLAQISEHTSVAEICFDNVLFYKGFLLNATTAIKHFAVTDPLVAEKFEQLKAIERRLSSEYAIPTADRDSANVVEIEKQINDLEKNLARTVDGYKETTRQVKWPEIQQNLRSDEAAIEFVNYPFFGKKIDQPAVETYGALVLLPSGLPKFIPLFEASQLEARLKITSARKVDYAHNLYHFTKNQSEKTLFELIWQPLEHALGRAKTIYFSPSGLLHRVNLGAIPIAEHEILADHFNFVQLGSTRQLTNVESPKTPSERRQTSEIIHQKSAVLLGGIRYEMDSTAIATANIELKNSEIASRNIELDFSETDTITRGGSWNFLKNTEKEVDTLQQILTQNGLKPATLKGFSATEEAFKNIGKSAKSPRILHIATHGFFFPDPKFSIKTSDREPVFKTSDHPMIRSGLMLAGANQAWKTGKSLKSNMEDGILTAYEIAQMNLSNTELVVLSACETGLGDIQGNEGVFGLQRAFKIAGAKHLIMSLWQVPDFQTQELMTVFYKKWLSDKLEIPEAFRSAQHEMRRKYLHPFFWAGFVLVE